MNSILLYLASAITCIWGIAHLFATKGVVNGFGDISMDNKRIITMEWIVEGIALISIASFVAVATFIQPESQLASGIYGTAIGSLLVLAIVSLFTGFKISFLPFRLCPFIFTLSALLIGLGAWM